MLTGDLDRLLAAEIGASAISTAGAWQPAPPDSAPAPGTYATSVAFRLAGRPARAQGIARTLAAALRLADWVCSATVTGGYVTVTVTPDALARLAVRITTAGPACARSTALADSAFSAPPDPDLATAPDWADARRRLAAHLTGRLAEAAGAFTFPTLQAERRPVPGPGPDGAKGPVADAIEFAGASAIRYALARMPPGTTAGVDPGHAAQRRLDVPAYAVRYAHAHATSTLSLGEAAEFDPRLLAHPSEQVLLDELSWLPERVAGAARRGRPDTFARYLERLAGAYFDRHEQCPAMWPGIGWGGGASTSRAWGGGASTSRARGGGAGTDRAGSPQVVARLWLAAASATALRAGLDLLGVDAPDRL